MTQDNVYAAYVDGSARSNPPRSGIGGLIYGPRNKLVTIFSHSIDTIESNTLAEISAVTKALDAIPAGSQVTIYNDDIGLCDRINRGALLDWRNKTEQRPDLQEAFKTLARAVGRHESVKALHTMQSKSDNIQRVDTLARAGALLDLAVMAEKHSYVDPKTPQERAQNALVNKISHELHRRNVLFAALAPEMDAQAACPPACAVNSHFMRRFNHMERMTAKRERHRPAP